MKNRIVRSACMIMILWLQMPRAYAQLSISAQLRARTEFRDGQGAPLPEGARPALFTSQRTRINAGFSTQRIKLGFSLQDVRVWGQDVSTINRTTTQDNNGLMVHEAWADVQLSDTNNRKRIVSLKIGRQELVYDDQRLIGNLDWLQQGRRHDAAVFKYASKKWMVHVGGAFNQNREKSSGTVYNAVPPGNYTATTNGGSMYKSLEFLYAGRKLGKGSLSFLFLSDQFNTYEMASIDNNPVKNYTNGTWARATTGVYVMNQFGNLNLTASAYYQFGKNGAGQAVNGSLLAAGAQYSFGKLSAGGGVDYTSSDFDPLYGTPHKFWGLMDYFYAASPFGNTGLVDYCLRTKLKASESVSVLADIHQFTSAIPVAGFSRAFGQEIDVVTQYSITKDINIEFGYSHFFSTTTLSSPAVKNIADAKSNANWAYIMINVKPEFIFK